MYFCVAVIVTLTLYHQSKSKSQNKRNFNNSFFHLIMCTIFWLYYFTTDILGKLPPSSIYLISNYYNYRIINYNKMEKKTHTIPHTSQKQQKRRQNIRETTIFIRWSFVYFEIAQYEEEEKETAYTQ